MTLFYLLLLGRIILLGFEKVFVKKLQKYDSVVVTFWWFFLSTVVFALLALARGPEYFFYTPLFFIAPLFYGVAFVLYTKSLKIADISLVSPLYNFNAVFLLVLASLFLGESFTVFKVLGILLLLFGSSFLTVGKNLFHSLRKLFTNRAALYMLICSLLIAFGRIIDGFVVQENDPVFYATMLDLIISVYLFIYILFRGKISKIFTIIKERPVLTSAMGISNGISYLFLLFAFTKIDVSIAEPATMLGAVVAILLGKIFFKEKIKSRMIGAFVMIIGAWLLFI
ncbi:DMT family transporter [Patescibacteria group bacterium]|nr:DMT family transporter [Patescibacteria group bacterium]